MEGFGGFAARRWTRPVAAYVIAAPPSVRFGGGWGNPRNLVSGPRRHHAPLSDPAGELPRRAFHDQLPRPVADADPRAERLAETAREAPGAGQALREVAGQGVHERPVL